MARPNGRHFLHSDQETGRHKRGSSDREGTTGSLSPVPEQRRYAQGIEPANPLGKKSPSVHLRFRATMPASIIPTGPVPSGSTWVRPPILDNLADTVADEREVPEETEAREATPRRRRRSDDTETWINEAIERGSMPTGDLPIHDGGRQTGEPGETEMWVALGRSSLLPIPGELGHDEMVSASRAALMGQTGKTSKLRRVEKLRSDRLKEELQDSGQLTVPRVEDILRAQRESWENQDGRSGWMAEGEDAAGPDANGTRPKRGPRGKRSRGLDGWSRHAR